MMCTRCQEITLRASEKKYVQRSIKMKREIKNIASFLLRKIHFKITTKPSNTQRDCRQTMEFQHTIFWTWMIFIYFCISFSFINVFVLRCVRDFMLLLLFHYSKHYDYVLMCWFYPCALRFRANFIRRRRCLFSYCYCVVVVVVAV